MTGNAGVFISHTENDRRFAEALSRALAARGFDATGLTGRLMGEADEERLREALTRAGLHVALLSDEALLSARVFFELGALRPDDVIKVTRADGGVAVFTVNAVRSYSSHKQFPTSVVYGGDLSHSTLRLITCSNFDSSIGHYVGNTVVYAHLTTIRHPSA